MVIYQHGAGQVLCHRATQQERGMLCLANPGPILGTWHSKVLGALNRGSGWRI